MSFEALVFDHRDSFVFNLVDDLWRLGARSRVIRTDLGLEQLASLLRSLDPALVVLSPGPGRPEEHGVLLPFLRTRPALPVLGVCLGLQAMVCALGGTVGPAEAGPVHGRSSRVVHDGDAIFEGLNSGFRAGRYHSLVALELPDELEPIAWTADRETILAVRHRTLPWVGIQFHPESILTPDGPRLISNVLRRLA